MTDVMRDTGATLDTGAALDTTPLADASRHDAASGSPPRAGLGRALEAVRRTVTIATLLRTLGAAAMVGSLSLFLLQGFDERGDLTRVFLLLGQTALLALAGLAVGYALREPKGARVFLTLCLISVPANFAVLGAMVYSIAPLDGGPIAANYPHFALWSAASPRELALALAAGIGLLAPLTLFGFAVLARRMALRLSIALLVASAVLLVPSRDPAIMAVLGGAVLVLVVTLVLAARRPTGETRLPLTFEERLALALVLLPSLILLGRSTLIHGMEGDAALPLALTAYYFLQRSVRNASGSGRVPRVISLLAGVTGASTALLLASLIADMSADAALLPAFAGLAGVLMLGIVRHVPDPATRRALGGLWTALMLVVLVPYTLLANSPLEAVAVGGVAVAIIAHGIGVGSRTRTVLGALALFGVLWWHGEGLLTLLLSGGWRALAGVGVITIVAGSTLERFGPALRLRLARRRDGDDHEDETHEDDGPATGASDRSLDGSPHASTVERARAA